MKMLKINHKYSISYDPLNNDRPENIYRHDEYWMSANEAFGFSNFLLSMFYKLLENERKDDA